MVDIRTLVIKTCVMFLIIALALFCPAGTIAWPAGWTYLALYFSFAVACNIWLFVHDPDLLRERMTGFTPDQKSWDKTLLVLAACVFLVWLVLMPLDAVRFHWSHIPTWLSIVGALLMLTSFWIFFLTFRENRFLSPVVRIQEDRGQTVVSTGPYRIVRHPMYFGAVMFLLGTTLLLGSWYGNLPGLALVLIFARRAVLEELTLKKELPGYDAYMTRVRYRLIPSVW